MLQDLRFALRMVLKQPGLSLVAILTMALGIGATSAVFSLIQGVLLTPPPYRQPQQLMLIPRARTDGKKLDSPRGWPSQQWMEWKEAKSFQGIGAYNWTFNFLIRQRWQPIDARHGDYEQLSACDGTGGCGVAELRSVGFWARTGQGHPAGV